jgi:protein TonB
MKNIARFVLLIAMLAPGLFAQTKMSSTAPARPEQIDISAGVAEKLLVHKSDIICPRIPMAARVKATVVVAFVLGKNGDVFHPKVVSGPAMLQKPVLEAVRKYKYKPYLLNGEAVDVRTTVLVTMDSYLDCHYE